MDTTKSHPVRKTLVEPVARSEAGRWYLINVAPKLDRVLLRLTGGRLTSVPVVPIVYLTHTGARSGRKMTSPLLYFTDGEDAIVMASNYGRRNHPGWYYNVKANPEVELCARGRTGRYRAEVTTGEDRDRLWRMAQGVTKAYSDYEERASRTIQVIRLSPLDPA